MIRYKLRLADPHKHLLEVRTIIPRLGNEVRLSLPSWIPGSYLLREFARLVVAVDARSTDAPVPFEKVDKNTWSFRPVGDELLVTMRIYAFDETVRGAYFDTRRAYFNGPCVFGWVWGRESEPVELEIEPGDHATARSWQVATAMRCVDADSSGFGRYAAESYDELIDHPFEIGVFEARDFIAGGVAHRFVLAGRSNTDLDRIATDLMQLCETQIGFFGKPAPFDRYVFLGLATSAGYGGLEHRASSSLMFSRDDLPKVGEQGTPPAYQRFLGLVSHEYFHAWHIKRTKPEAFVPYQLSRRNHTRQLWVFEGITSYYQDLFVLRSGLIGTEAYLQRLAEMLTRVYRTPGRKLQTVEQSSFDAWDVLYKPMPGSVNSSISYYSKGALVALALDLSLRHRSASRLSLDTLVRELWTRYGKRGKGVPERAIEVLASELAGCELRDFFDTAVRGTQDLPVEALLREFGIEMRLRAATGTDDRGGKVSGDSPGMPAIGCGWRDAPRGLELTSVLDGGPAECAGLCPGDILVALDGLALDSRSLGRILARHEPGDRLGVVAFRDQVLIEREIVLEAAPADTCSLQLAEAPGNDELALRQAWLGE